MCPRHARHRHLGKIVERREPVVIGVIVGSAVGHLDQESARTLDHERQRVVGGDQMRIDTEPEHVQAVLKIMLPDGLVPFHELLSAPHVVDKDVKPARFGADFLNQPFDLVGDAMIDPDGDAPAARSLDELCRFLDGFRPAIFGWVIACCPPGHVDRCAGRAQFDGDTATGTTRCACDQGDFSNQGHGILLQDCIPPWH
jgi:hypothetical protein